MNHQDKNTKSNLNSADDSIDNLKQEQHRKQKDTNHNGRQGHFDGTAIELADLVAGSCAEQELIDAPCARGTTHH